MGKRKAITAEGIISIGQLLPAASQFATVFTSHKGLRAMLMTVLRNSSETVTATASSSIKPQSGTPAFSNPLEVNLNSFLRAVLLPTAGLYM